jgi:hypothetical protein
LRVFIFRQSYSFLRLRDGTVRASPPVGCPSCDDIPVHD